MFNVVLTSIQLDFGGKCQLNSVKWERKQFVLSIYFRIYLIHLEKCVFGLFSIATKENISIFLTLKMILLLEQTLDLKMHNN